MGNSYKTCKRVGEDEVYPAVSIGIGGEPYILRIEYKTHLPALAQINWMTDYSPGHPGGESATREVGQITAYYNMPPDVRETYVLTDAYGKYISGPHPMTAEAAINANVVLAEEGLRYVGSVHFFHLEENNYYRSIVGLLPLYNPAEHIYGKEIVSSPA